ncbi:entericidin A/B family lipoprotein [Paraburkholderia bonniea]|nr:entericidin A/B family lipoprotein [Paraburkholderia bonniea]WJF91737.1 entericidin A/B family lipoprotein [Paraburkholderia bonniea]WJF95057.1 entericidin A/B family lipoprotein [Paraburkholderia bonniea]
MKHFSLPALLRGLGFGVLAVVLAGLAGCNTVHGFGRDLQHLGSSISNKT